MSNGRSRNPFAHILRFVYFTISACSLVWMLAQYGGVNFVSTLILVPAFGYLALHLISLVNVVKKDKFLVGSSCDVLSLGAQKWIHRIGMALPIPVLLYVAGFSFCVFSYNANDIASVNRVSEFASSEIAMFSKSVIWNYLPRTEVTPIAVYPSEPESAEVPAVPVVPAAYNVRNSIDYQPYMNEMQRRIKRAWFPPKCATSQLAKVTFKTSKDGYISDIKFVTHSSTKTSDDAALRALANAQPLPKLPEGSPDKMDVEFTFDYNVFSEANSSKAYTTIQPDPIAPIAD